MPAQKPPYLDAANAVAEAGDCDVLFYNGPIGRPIDWQLMELVRSRQRRRKTVMLVLVTGGGDPDAAYRIARCLQDKYSRFVCLVPGFCKSAGTIVTLGAHELVMADGGEIGPLDVQMSKQDELLQRQSGLTATAALETLNEKAYAAFEHFTIQIVTRTGVSTRAAMQVAVQLASGLFAPTYAHVDPMHVGEAGRAMRIAQRYGELLQRKSQNIDPTKLAALAEEYPSHSFIIDRDEAQNIFQNVRATNQLEDALVSSLGQAALVPQTSPDQLFMAYLSTEQPEPAVQSASGPTNVSPISQVGDHDQVQDASATANTSEATNRDPGGNNQATERPHVAEVRPISGAA
jgi:hypothetical protein